MFFDSYSQWTTMPNDDTNEEQAKDKRSLYDTFFAIPPPLKHIFDRTPLVTYAANELPSRSPRNRSRNVLHVFTSPEDARDGRPSFNPACLKWQTYLKTHGIDFQTVESNNHASPSGSLPFLITGETGEVVAGNKLKRWVATQKKGEKMKEVEDVRYEAYTSLLDHRIRRAWLYQLYLHPSNASLLHDLYIRPCSSNPFVQMTIAHQLRSAATSELVKSNPSSSPSHPTIDEAEIMGDAEEAFAALAELLGGREWFFGQEKPGLFDASVHAYLELLIGEGMQWKENKLGEMVKKYEGLVKHREKVKEIVVRLAPKDAYEAMADAARPMMPPLTNIAAELRNQIFELVLIGAVEEVEIGPDGRIGPEPDLLSVCRQIRDETRPVFTALAPESAGRINVTVRDFDFKPLQCFIDNLNSEQMEAIVDRQSLRIVIKLGTASTDPERVMPDLKEWLSYCSSKLDKRLTTSLAAELRSSICELVILDERQTARVGPNGNLIKKPALLAVCHQLRQETLPVYLDLAPGNAECMSVNITNFDFAPVITYLDTLSSEQRGAVAEKHNLRIVIKLTQDCERAGWPGVRRWITYHVDNLAGFDLTGTTTENNAYAWVVDYSYTWTGQALERALDNMDDKFELMHS
ncbi:hypothetical protein LTR17_005253 [Elasticomyces elasticus]|nr:hypothetical protein LTR17_005253 [Elasticomyces elasticus]